MNNLNEVLWRGFDGFVLFLVQKFYVIAKKSSLIKKITNLFFDRFPKARGFILYKINSTAGAGSYERDDFVSFMDKFIEFECFQHPKVDMVGRYICRDYLYVHQRLADRCDIKFDMYFVWFIRSGGRVKLINRVSLDEQKCLIHLVGHIYIALLRRYPNSIEEGLLSKFIIDRQDLNEAIAYVRQAPEFSAVGCRTFR